MRTHIRSHSKKETPQNPSFERLLVLALLENWALMCVCVERLVVLALLENWALVCVWGG